MWKFEQQKKAKLKFYDKLLFLGPSQIATDAIYIVDQKYQIGFGHVVGRTYCLR